MEQSNTFKTLASVDVGSHIEKKGRFSYLSWPFAVSALRERFPDATWEVQKFDGFPYLQTPLGFFVETSVTVGGITLSHMHPVLDQRNNPVQKPNAFQINTSVMRCLVKNISLHGLGLYIYAGEDLPITDSLDEPAIPYPGGEPEDDSWKLVIDDIRSEICHAANEGNKAQIKVLFERGSQMLQEKHPASLTEFKQFVKATVEGVNKRLEQEESA